MKKMLQILEELGLTKNTYFMQQVGVCGGVGIWHSHCVLLSLVRQAPM